jgi:hypothetical protein
MDILERLAAEAIRLGADALEVEYKDRHEWVFAASGPVAFGIARFRSSSPDAARLREQCYRLARQKRPQRISDHGREYELRCAIYDSFGEDAFRLALRLVPKTRSDVQARSTRTRVHRVEKDGGGRSPAR